MSFERPQARRGPLTHGVNHLAGLLGWGWEYVASTTRSGAAALLLQLRLHLRLDVSIGLLAALYILAFAPLIPRSTDNPQLLAAFVNDEPWQTMSLEGMATWPYGNPGNFFYHSELPAHHNPKIPPHWGHLSYTGVQYYGGAYVGIAFAAFGPLHWLGAPAFPLAPMTLRFVSAVAGLLSLIVLYNFGRIHSGAATGFIAALFLLTTVDFVYYASIIHPDTLQLFFALLALAVAIEHARKGDIATLVALGMLAGLVQGTKVGGPWLVPMSLLALYWGLKAARVPADRTIAGMYLRRCLGLLIVTVAAFFASTPYAALDPYYFLTLRTAMQGNLAPGAFGELNLAAWAQALHAQWGNVLAAVIVLGLLRTAVLWALGKEKPALALAFVLALSQFLWYGYLGRWWVVTAYLLVFTGLSAALGAHALLAPLARSGKTILHRAAAGAIVAMAVATILYQRGPAFAIKILEEHLRSNATVVEAGRWAERTGLSGESRIVFDDFAYFPPHKFPQARMHGGVLTYFQLLGYDPDYVVLSSYLYNAPWFKKLQEGPRPPRYNADRLSPRLYQDLLKTDHLGPTSAPWIELVHKIDWSLDTAPHPSCAAENRHGGGAILATAGCAITSWGYPYLGRLLLNVAGLAQEFTGPRLRIYRIHPPGGERGRARAVSSGEKAGHRAHYAFDHSANAWVSSASGASAVGSYIGMDFGGGTAQTVDTVRVTWISQSTTPAAVSIEHSEDGQSWRSAGTHRTDFQRAAERKRIQEFRLAAPTSARFWRVVAAEVPGDAGFGVVEVEFVGQR